MNLSKKIKKYAPVFGYLVYLGYLNKLFRSKNKVPKENFVWIFFYDFLGNLYRYKYPTIKNVYWIFLYDFLGNLYRYTKWKIKSLFFKYSEFTFSTGTNSPRNRREKFNKHFLLLGICTGPYTLNFETLGFWCCL